MHVFGNHEVKYHKTVRLRCSLQECETDGELTTVNDMMNGYCTHASLRLSKHGVIEIDAVLVEPQTADP